MYETFEEIVGRHPELSALRSTGLERSEALRQDLAFLQTIDASLTPLPPCGRAGMAYREFLLGLVDESLPRFICHYYNHYFAHTAGGRMMGRKLAEALLQGKTLAFYQWEGDVKELLEAVRRSIDQLAQGWGPEERRACMEETQACFDFGGSLMSYMKAPGDAPP